LKSPASAGLLFFGKEKIAEELMTAILDFF
jgi:hypothetical protein